MVQNQKGHISPNVAIAPVFIFAVSPLLVHTGPVGRQCPINEVWDSISGPSYSWFRASAFNKYFLHTSATFWLPTF